MKKLIDYVDILENNEECVVLKVLPESKKGLICLGYFTGKETMFRLTKGNTQTCTVFYNDNTIAEWYWGHGGSTCVSEATRKTGHLIQACIEQDLDITINGSPSQIKNDLVIQSKADVKNRYHTIEVMGHKEECIHRDGTYYCTSVFGLQNIIDHFTNLGWTIIEKPVKSTATNGCPIWTFHIKK